MGNNLEAVVKGNIQKPLNVLPGIWSCMLFHRCSYLMWRNMGEPLSHIKAIIY